MCKRIFLSSLNCNCMLLKLKSATLQTMILESNKTEEKQKWKNKRRGITSDGERERAKRNEEWVHNIWNLWLSICKISERKSLHFNEIVMLWNRAGALHRSRCHACSISTNLIGMFKWLLLLPFNCLSVCLFFFPLSALVHVCVPTLFSIPNLPLRFYDSKMNVFYGNC